MREQFDGWIKSSHRRVAVCNDCHTPHGLIAKYASKASNGFWHSFGFTTGRFPEPIRIKQHNLDIAEQACRSCHAELASAIEGTHPQARTEHCTRCHHGAGHY
jgi:cytochrome c nitrite reductase small subunit